MADIAEFLQRYTGEPFVWGKSDCALWVASWWAENHGVDPAAKLRSTYASEEEKEALVAREGGLLRLVSGLAASVGAKRLQNPQRGSFAIIEPGICAIWTGDFWAVRSPTGIVFIKEAKAWRIWSI